MPSSRFRLLAALLAGLIVLTLVSCGGAVQSPSTRSKENRSTLSDVRQSVAQRMDGLVSAFQREDVGGFMDQVALNFLGDRIQLESDLDEQLSKVNNIELQYFVDRMITNRDHVDLRFHWDRRWRDVNSGRDTRASGRTTFRFVRQAGEWLLQDIRGDRPFLK